MAGSATAQALAEKPVIMLLQRSLICRRSRRGEATRHPQSAQRSEIQETHHPDPLHNDPLYDAIPTPVIRELQGRKACS
jgi:hypothetical protein